MTENKQIIIDGVDVSGCEFLTKTGHCKAHMSIMGTDTNKCECFSNCYYKQLKRKEQECFELQMTANAYNPLVKLANYRLDKIEDLQEQLDQLKAENERLQKTQFCFAYEKDCHKVCKQQNCIIKNGYKAEQKLEKIRQVCTKAKDVENIKDMYTAKLSGLYLKSRQILQIIDEVE